MNEWLNQVFKSPGTVFALFLVVAGLANGLGIALFVWGNRQFNKKDNDNA